jgi:hypothetical protein
MCYLRYGELPNICHHSITKVSENHAYALSSAQVYDLRQLVHPCNLKEFKLLVGMTEDHMTEVLHATLKNDEKPETFKIPHVTEHGVQFPTKFVKIVTISCVSPCLYSERRC